jgi:hypothetical protein
MWILGPSKARPGQSDLRVGSVFHKEYLGFNDLAKKSTKRWLEVATSLHSHEVDGHFKPSLC